MSREYEFTIIEEINGALRKNMAQPLQLGGISGPDGGTGGPPGGFIGLLPQTKITYDETEAATLVTVESGNLVDNLNHIRYRLNEVESGVSDHYVQMTLVNYTEDIFAGDGRGYLVIPPNLDGMNLIFAHARVITAGTTGTTDIQVHNETDAVDMLSTKVTIDSGEVGSETATPYAIDTTKDDVVQYDLIRVDVDAVSTISPKGLIVTLGFSKP